MAIIFDLQGTLGGEAIGDIRSFEFYDGVLESLKRVTHHRLMVMTNQSHIAKGEFSLEIYYHHEKRLKDLLLNNLTPMEFYCCPHINDDHCACKKPKTGMYEKARAIGPMDDLYMIGDMGKSDMMFGEAIGAYKILVLTGVGQGSLMEFRHTWTTDADFIADNVQDAIQHILEREHDRKTKGL